MRCQVQLSGWGCQRHKIFLELTYTQPHTRVWVWVCWVQSVACCILNEYFMGDISREAMRNDATRRDATLEMTLAAAVCCWLFQLTACASALNYAMQLQRVACVLHFNGRPLSQPHLPLFMVPFNEKGGKMQKYNKIFIDIAHLQWRRLPQKPPHSMSIHHAAPDRQRAGKCTRGDTSKNHIVYMATGPHPARATFISIYSC